ncbi:MAG: TetR/AcrR family transcriptional regulator [Acidimicrobiales bacterium]
MFAEETLCPTIGQAAKGSGLSLRSLYRYFADPAGLLEAVIARSSERSSRANCGEPCVDARSVTAPV